MRWLQVLSAHMPHHGVKQQPSPVFAFAMSSLSRLRAFGTGRKPGPSKAAEMFSWAQNVWEALSPARQSLLAKNVEEGIELLTVYSGKGSAESIFHQVADHVLQEKMRAAGEPGQQPVQSVLRVSSACDKKPLCRGVLGGLAAAQPEHIFGDICGRVRADVRAEVEKKLPKSSATRAEKASSNEAVRKHLFENGRRAFNQDVAAFCHRHGRNCRIWESVETVTPQSRDKLVIAAAGTSCTDYSPRRTGEAPGLAGPTAHPFYVWLGEMRTLKPDMVFYENVPGFPADKLTERLPGYTNHQIMAFSVDYGFPVSRKRIFGVLTLNETSVLDVDLISFEKEFKRACQTNGDVFFLAPPEDVLSAYEDRAKSRGNFIRRAGSRESWTPEQFLNVLDLSKVVTCTMLNRVDDYENWLAARFAEADACYILDLDQNPGFSSVGSLIPSVPTHSSLYSLQKKRLLTGNEALASYGENLYHSQHAPASLLPRDLL